MFRNDEAKMTVEPAIALSYPRYHGLTGGRTVVGLRSSIEFVFTEQAATRAPERARRLFLAFS